MLYFNPKIDVRVYRFHQIILATDFPPLFSRIEIIVDYPFKLIITVLLEIDIPKRFPNLTHLLIREEVDSAKEMLRNDWDEDLWKKESRLRQDSWDAGWEPVQERFRDQGIVFVTSRNSGG